MKIDNFLNSFHQIISLFNLNSQQTHSKLFLASSNFNNKLLNPDEVDGRTEQKVKNFRAHFQAKQADLETAAFSASPKERGANRKMGVFGLRGQKCGGIWGAKSVLCVECEGVE